MDRQTKNAAWIVNSVLDGHSFNNNQYAIHIMLSIPFVLSVSCTHTHLVCLSNFRIIFFVLLCFFIFTEAKYKIHENFILSSLVNVFVLQMTCQHFFFYDTYFFFSFSVPFFFVAIFFCSSTYFTNIICKYIKINVRPGKWKHGKCICFSECKMAKLKLNYHHIPAHNAINFFTFSNFSIHLRRWRKKRRK